MNITENITDRHMALRGIRDAEVACALEFAMNLTEAGQLHRDAKWSDIWAIAQNRDETDTLADLVDLIAEAEAEALAAAHAID